MQSAETPLIVVVPARNEEARISACLASLAAQSGAGLQVLMSDNASTDGTAAAVALSSDTLALTARTVGPLGPSEHFVSAIRWALESTTGEFFALLAGDDTWSPGFAVAALGTLAARPDVDVVFPAFVWEGDGPERPMAPASFLQPSPVRRQLAALLLPDGRELSNLVYGVYRRAAFADLAAAWAEGGDEYGADFAAAWSVIGDHRVAACDSAIGRRFVRPGADLIERLGFQRPATLGPLATAWLYVRISVAMNTGLAKALRRVGTRRDRPRTVTVQLVRAPQWIWNAIRQLRHGIPRSG